MNNTIKKNALITTLAAVGLFGAAGANAGGVGGDIINFFAPGVGTMLDQAHAALGNPLDHLVQSQALPPLSRPQPFPQPQMNPWPQQPMVAQAPMGNVCYTYNGARVFGPWNPLGMDCYTPYGPGKVGR